MTHGQQFKSEGSEEMWPKMLGEFEKEGVIEGAGCIFPRKQGPALRVVNILAKQREQTEQSQRRLSRASIAWSGRASTRWRYRILSAHHFSPRYDVMPPGPVPGTCLDQYPTVNESWRLLLLTLLCYWWNLQQRQPTNQPFLPADHLLFGNKSWNHRENQGDIRS